jgi:hypothetical protein
MQKIFITLLCVLLLAVAHGQTISKKEAKQILEKAWSCLITPDSVSFVNLWRPGNTTPERAIDYFNYLKQFLDTALKQNLKINNVEIEEKNLKGTDTKYWIKAWFKYSEHDYKGFGFYIAPNNGKWVMRGEPSTSRMKKD